MVPPASGASSLPHPWNGVGDLYFSLNFWLVGIVYLIRWLL